MLKSFLLPLSPTPIHTCVFILHYVHSMKRLVGYDGDSQEHNPETLRHYLYGGHVADYMRLLVEEDEEKYKAHFAKFIKEGVTADGVSETP